MEQSLRSPTIEHFIPAPDATELPSQEDSPACDEPEAASDNSDVPEADVEVAFELDDDDELEAAEAELVEDADEEATDTHAAPIDGVPDLGEGIDESTLLAIALPKDGDATVLDASPVQDSDTVAVAPVEDEAPAESVTPAVLRVSVEGGRVLVHIPSGASVAAFVAGLASVTLPGGVLWLSLGARPTTADEIAALCAAAQAGLGRQVAGVRAYRGGLADGVRQLAGVAVEFDGESSSGSSAEQRGRQVLVVERTLRSGSSTKFRGDVLVYGDVNAGAEIEAAGNIVVLGTLRGLAWAGSGGEDSAMIISFDLRPTQLRIGRRIAFLPERPRGRGPRLPEVAVVRDGEIVLQEYRGRLG